MSAWVGSTNLGDELVLASLLAKLRARGVEPFCLSVDPPGTTLTHGVGAGTVVDLLRRPGGRPPATVLGGGGLLQDETSPLNLPYHVGRTLAASAPTHPLAAVGLGAGPVHGAVGRTLVRVALRRAVGVSVRDAASVEALARLGVDATLAADLAVALPTPQVEVEGRVAVCLRPWTGTRSMVPVAWRHRPGADRTTAPPWFLAGMAVALDRIVADTGLAVHFVSFHAGRDDGVHRAVADLMRSACTFATPAAHTVVAEVAACEAVVAMRYHAGIAALLGGRPAVLIGYSPKVPSLALEAPGGMTGLRWDPDSLSHIPSSLADLLDGGAEVVEARERLRVRERANDVVLDRLLEAAGRRP